MIMVFVKDEAVHLVRYMEKEGMGIGIGSYCGEALKNAPVLQIKKPNENNNWCDKCKAHYDQDG